MPDVDAHLDAGDVAVVLSVVAANAAVVLVRMAGELFGGVGLVVLAVPALGLLAWYMAWRGRRNRKLTGAPTRCPDQDI